MKSTPYSRWIYELPWVLLGIRTCRMLLSIWCPQWLLWSIDRHSHASSRLQVFSRSNPYHWFSKPDGHKTPLQRPYEVQSNHARYHSPLKEYDSVDRLKVAHINPDEPAQLLNQRDVIRPVWFFPVVPQDRGTANSGRALNLPHRYRS